jgi:hypothetical protein
MLLPRTLDAPAVRRSEGVFGTKAFVFTDDLDVTNRLFSNILDAEGQRYYGQQTKQVKAPLASMRMPIPGDVGGQRRAGQSWDLPLALGHQFKTTGLKVSRTTSQDAGVDFNSQLIVATASLELGFDDPDVGAVLQHKAPRGVAAFLQRKGRAGRTRGMRPYTAVVLSDYGRDRATYEAWDALFDPMLPRLVMPIRNRAVLRMQAALATMDWLAEQVRSQKPYANLWRDLSSINNARYGQQQRETQLVAADLLNKVLRDPSLQHSLREWIAGALKLPNNVVDEILWHPPRAVILAAVPTLARRLQAEWAVAAPSEPVQRARAPRGLRPRTTAAPRCHRARDARDGHGADAARVRPGSRLPPIRHTGPQPPALDTDPDRRARGRHRDPDDPARLPPRLGLARRHRRHSDPAHGNPPRPTQG